MNENPSGHVGQLREIVEFAIEKEQEAIDFYTDLARKVKTASIAGELRNLAGMEQQHKARLQAMDLESVSQSVPGQVGDLKIADYLVPLQPSATMTWQEILNIAMHREMAANALYRELSSRVVDPRARTLFENLAAEEARHKLYFEKIWDDEILIEN